MKICLPVLVAISALSVLTTTVHSQEKSPSKPIESATRVDSLNASSLNSATADISGLESRENYVLDLAANNNSFALNAAELSTTEPIIKRENLAQSGYSATTEILNF